MASFSKSNDDFKLPAEALKFAKQFGLDLKGLEPEAQQIWKHLEKLSNESPVEYERFVSEQMQLAKEESDGNDPKKSGSGRSFRPNPGFCIQLTTTGGDGLKVRDYSKNKGGKTLYVNITHSKVVDEAKDNQGNPLTIDRLNADGLEIPLVIGPVRPFNESTNAIDAIYHTTVIDICQKNIQFKKQIIDLSLEWILQETELKFVKEEYENVSGVSYKGGLGDEEATPVLFNIDDADPEAKKKSTSTSKKEDPLNSTKSLLSELQKEKPNESSLQDKDFKLSTTPASANNNIDIKIHPNQPTKEKTDTSKDQSPKIIDISEPTTKVNFNIDEKIQDKPTAPTTTTKIETKPMKEYKPPSKLERDEIQSLLEQCDNELAGSNSILGGSQPDDFNILSSLAKAFTVKKPGETSQETIQSNISNSSQPVNETLRIINPQPDLIKIQAKMEVKPGGTLLEIEISNLSAQATGSSILLEVSEKEVRLSCQLSAFQPLSTTSTMSTSAISIALIQYQGNKFILNTKEVKASLKKKLGKMIVLVPCKTNK